MTPEQMRALAQRGPGPDESGQWATEVRTALRAAADEVDRLRAELDQGLAITKQYAKDGARQRQLLQRDVHRLRVAIENAPHREQCRPHIACTCWKADAL